MVVRELLTKLGFTLDKSSLGKAEEATKRIKESANGAAQGIKTMLGAYLGFASVRMIAKTADEMQSARARIALLPQTVGDVGESFDTVAARANDARQSVEAYTSLYVRVGHAAKKYISTQEELLTVTDAVSQGLVVGGASAAESASVMLQLSQALGSGVLQGQEFNAMAEGAPQLLDKLAVAMNIPRENLKKMASEGKVTTKDLVLALKKVAPEIKKEFAGIPLTIGQAMTITGNRFGMMIDRMNRETLFVTKIADIIIGAFDKIEAGAKWLHDVFDGWGNMFRYIGIVMGLVFGYKAIAMIVAFGVKGWIALLPYLAIAAAVLLVAAALEDLYVWIQGGDSIIGKWLGTWQEWRDGVLGFIDDVVSAVKAAWKMVTDFSASFMSQIEATEGGGVAGIGLDRAAGNPTSISSNTNVNVTVPAGTSQEQAAYIESAAQKSFQKQNDAKLARDIAVYAP